MEHSYVIHNADLILEKLAPVDMYVFKLIILKDLSVKALKDPISNWSGIPLEKLLRDNFITSKTGIYEPNSPDARQEIMYRITFEGVVFLSKGGYKGKFEQEELLQKKNLDQMQSVIDTNASVKATNKFQKIALFISSVLALGSIIISIITLLKTANIVIKPTPVTIKNEIRIPTSDSTANKK